MDQAAVHAAVAVLERMDIDEAECGGRRLQHRVDAVFAHAVIRFQQAAHEIVEISGPGADEFRRADRRGGPVHLRRRRRDADPRARIAYPR